MRAHTPQPALLLVALCALATPAAAGSRADTAALARRIVQLTNERRAEEGLRPVRQNAQLDRAAQRHSEHMAARQTLAHELEGSTLVERVERAGYAFALVGENVALNQPSAQAVVASWMGSAGHRANILREGFTEIGVGVAYDARGRPYYTQVFAAPRSAARSEAGHSTRFTLENRTPQRLVVELPGGARGALPPRVEGQYRLTSSTAQAPEVRILAGARELRVRPRDGARYVVQAEGRGVSLHERPARAPAR